MEITGFENVPLTSDIGVLDLGTALLEPLRPLRTHLTLVDGVLTLADLDARTGHGDSRQCQSRRSPRSSSLECCSERQQCSPGAVDACATFSRRSPYLSGKLGGQVKLAGSGRSTAEILSSLKGDVRFHLTDVKLSHLALKAAGLDVAMSH